MKRLIKSSGVSLKNALPVTALLCGMLVLTACSQQEQAVDAAKIADLTERLNKMEAQLVEAEDVSAIKRLTRTYGYYLDKGLWGDLADLLTDDAVVNYPAGIYIGKESIRKHYFENIGHGKLGLDEGQLYNHMILQPVVDINPDGKTANGRWRAWAWMARWQRSANMAEGPYEMQYRKENGVWKISGLRFYSSSGISYEEGWSRKREPSSGSRMRNLPHPPDQPLDNSDCPPFPDTCVPPFHYANPVSGRKFDGVFSDGPVPIKHEMPVGGEQ